MSLDRRPTSYPPSGVKTIRPNNGDMSPGQRALAIDLMLAFARAEIMTPAFFPKGHGEAN